MTVPGTVASTQPVHCANRARPVGARWHWHGAVRWPGAVGKNQTSRHSQQSKNTRESWNR